MSNTLIAVVTCHSRREWADAARRTWAPVCQRDVDVMFFAGRNVELAHTVSLDCDDSYQGLPDKVREIMRFAYRHQYDHILKCDDDVVIDQKGLLSSGFELWDFVGHESSPKSSVPYGFNYWLSRRAIEIVAQEPLPTNNNDEAWVTHALSKHSIRLHNDPRYRLHIEQYQDWNDNRRPLRKSAKQNLPDRKYFSWCLHNKTVSLEASLVEYERLFKKTQEA